MAEDNSSRREAADQLTERLDQLEDLLHMQTARLHTIEQRLGINFQPDNQLRARVNPPAPAANLQGARAEDSSIEAERGDAGRAHAGGGEGARLSPPPVEVVREPSAQAGDAGDHLRNAARGGGGAQSRFDVEALIGGSWFNWIGIIAVAFGVAFFLKYAWDNEWIGPAARVLLGAAAGLSALAAGEFVRRRGLRQYASVVSGGGVLILYLSAYAAFGFGLIGQLPALMLMIAVTATAVVLSVRYDALPIAMLGLIGGFLTPVLLSTGQDNQAGLFGYIALLDAGVLALAYYKGWRSLNYSSFILTLLTFIAWLGTYYEPPKLWLTVLFLILFFLLFSALAVLHNVLKRRPARWFDVSLIIANATFFFGVSYELLDAAGFGPGLSSFALVVSAFFVLLYYFAYRRHRADQLLTYSYLGAAVTFFTLAVAIQLDQHWVTIAWATEALMLTWVGLRSATSAPRHAALVVFAVALAHWVGVDLSEFAADAGGMFMPLLNRRSASGAALVASCAVAAWLYRGDAEKVEERERTIITALLTLTANALALTLLSLDVNEYFERRITTRLAEDQTGASGEAGRLRNSKQFALTFVWTIYAVAAIAFGVVRRAKLVRLAGLSLLAVSALKLLALDVSYSAAWWHAPVFNQTVAAFALVVGALGAVLWLYARRGAGTDEGERAVVMPSLVVAANLLAVVGLSAEAWGYFEARINRAAESALPTVGWLDLRLAQQLALSVIWTIYGGAMLVVGIVRESRLLRVMALILLSLTTLKVFFWDLAALDRIYRIISFVVLGAILLGVSYIYQKGQQRMRAVNE